MTTEAQIDISREDALASLKGAALSTFIAFGFLVSAFFIPSTPNDDGHIRGAAIMIGYLPLAFFVFLGYFLALSMKKKKRLKFAILVQTFFILTVCAYLFSGVYEAAGLTVAIINALYLFCFLSVVFGLGSWLWSRRKSHNESLKNDAQKTRSF